MKTRNWQYRLFVNSVSYGRVAYTRRELLALLGSALADYSDKGDQLITIKRHRIHKPRRR